jgi:hypothetical protein
VANIIVAFEGWNSSTHGWGEGPWGEGVSVSAAMYFKVTSAGNLTATRTLTIAPNTISRVMFIENATSGSQSIAISQGSGANVTIATGKTAVVYLDGAGAGAAVVDAMAGVDPGVTDTLTEVLVAGNTSGGTNIELSTTDKVQFRDTGIYINSSVDGQLDIVADTEIQIAATTVDLNGNLDVSGTALVAGVLTTTAATVFNGGFASNADSTLGTDKKVQFRDSAIYINSSVDGQLDIVADTEIQIAATTVDLNGNLDVSGTLGVTGVATLASLVATTADINAGTIDNTVIGGTTAAAISGTTGQFATSLNVDGTVTADGLTVDTDTLVVDATNNRVGIGTSSPLYNVDLLASSAVSMIRTNDTTSPTLGLFVNSGSNGVGTISVDNGGHMTFDTGANGAGQQERLRIDASGQLTTTGAAAFGGNVIIPAASILYFDGGGDTFMREPSPNIVQVNTAGALAMTIDATQNVIIEGYVYPNSGIYLGGSVAANLLDDYEEGTWTPAYTPTTGTFTTITTVGAGSYTKVGRLVTVFGSVRTSGTLDVTGASGNLKITGLPFACNATAAGGGADLSHQSWNLGTDILNTRMSVAAGASEILMFNNTMNGSSFPSGNITVADMSTSGGSFSNLIAFTASYQV